ncbi:hypothetical protein LXL04_018728 [Taraxacum kok-saghyz]
MGTKVKGFFKGLKNISNIFDDDEKEEEIQIGMPTDVKHVAHIGADGPAVESPSWMKDFDTGKSQSGPMGQNPYIQKGTNNNHRISRSEELPRDPPEKPKQHRHRHHRSIDSDSDSQTSTRSKHTRRHRIRRSKDKGDESTKLPDIPKRSRRKKPNDDDVSVKSTQSQDTASLCSEPPSDL